MKYTTTGMRTVEAEDMSEAARVFAQRAARLEFGRRGYARTCKLDSYTQDGRLAEYSAFIGYTADRREPNTTTGHDIRFAVHREAQP